MAKMLFTDRQQIEQVIRRASYCQVAFSVAEQPYVVPMNFGYAENCFFFHARAQGKKLDLLRANPRVAFGLQTDVSPLHDAEKAENCSMRYISVCGSGLAEMIEDTPGKIAALDCICQQYGLAPYTYTAPMLNAIVLFKIVVTEMTGKIANIDCEEIFTAA